MQAEILVRTGAADCLVFRTHIHPTEHRKAITLHKPFHMASTAPTSPSHSRETQRLQMLLSSPCRHEAPQTQQGMESSDSLADTIATPASEQR